MVPTLVLRSPHMNRAYEAEGLGRLEAEGSRGRNNSCIQVEVRVAGRDRLPAVGAVHIEMGRSGHWEMEGGLGEVRKGEMGEQDRYSDKLLR